MTALPERAAALIDVLDKLFVGRRDVYARSTNPGAACIEKPLTLDVWRQHLYGEQAIGVYPLMPDGTRWVCQWACIDIDDAGNQEKAADISRTILRVARERFAIKGHLEISKSKGFHLWFFLSAPCEAWQVRAVLRTILESCQLSAKQSAKGKEIAIFPKQDALTNGDRFGNLVFIPWFGPNTRIGKQAFCDPATLRPYPDQLAAMSCASLNHPADFARLVEQLELKPGNVTPLDRTPPASKPAKAKGVSIRPEISRADPGSVPALSQQEFDNLCSKLKSLRNARNSAATCSYNDWLSALVHLVPFANGHQLARGISELDAERFNPSAFELKWTEAVKIYHKRNVLNVASISQQMVEGWRAGGRTDIIPITNRFCIWKSSFARRNWVVTSTGVWTENEPTPLTNFYCWITLEDYEDDGTGELRRLVHLEGQMTDGRPLPEITVDAEEWSKVRTWVHRGWGAKLVIETGDNNAGHVIEMISRLGQDAREIRSYVHTGWITWNGKAVFITPSGPIGLSPEEAEEFAHDNRVSIPVELHGYSIPAACTIDEAVIGFDWIETIINMGGDGKVLIPLFACAFLAPLATILQTDLAVALIGQTGTMKSSIVGLFMTLFGSKFDRNNLQTSFMATTNYIERLGFHAKDLPMCVDNYLPSQKNENALIRMAHSVGDRAGRGRMTSGQRLVGTRPFRSLLITTGEDFPDAAESTAMRMLRCQLHRDETFVKPIIRDAQIAGARGELAPAMTWYINWLASRVTDPAFVDGLKAKYEKYREAQLNSKGVHGRVYEQIAWVRVAYDLMKESHPSTISSETLRRLKATIDEITALRSEESLEFCLPRRFLIAFFAMIQNQQARGVGMNGGLPPIFPEMFGYRQTGNEEWQPLNQLAIPCAYVDNKGGSSNWFVYLEPELVISQIRGFARGNLPFQEGARAVGSALRAAKVLIGFDDHHLTTKVSLAGRRTRAWKLHGPAMLHVLNMETETETKIESEPERGEETTNAKSEPRDDDGAPVC